MGTQGTWLCGLRNVETPKRSEKWHLGKCQSSEEVLGRGAPPPRKTERVSRALTAASERGVGVGGQGQLKAWAQSRPRKGRSPAGPGTAVSVAKLRSEHRTVAAGPSLLSDRQRSASARELLSVVSHCERESRLIILDMTFWPEYG